MCVGGSLGETVPDCQFFTSRMVGIGESDAIGRHGFIERNDQLYGSKENKDCCWHVKET